jgi:iron complex transport system substrate-binding protein
VKKLLVFASLHCAARSSRIRQGALCLISVLCAVAALSAPGVVVVAGASRVRSGNVAASSAYPMRVRDDRGKTVEIPSKPLRIVSLTPGTTELLFALGLKDRIVGVTKYCDYPRAAKSKPKVAGMSVSAEAVIAQRPDLVVAHKSLNDAAIPQLEKLGLKVFAIEPNTISQIARDIRTLGLVTARPRTADAIASKVEKAVSEVRDARKDRPIRRVLVVVQCDPLWVAGPRTFVDEMLRMAHAENVARDARAGFVPFSVELSVARNPEVIIVGTKSEAEFFLKSPIWRQCDAVRNKRVYVIDSDLLVRPGLRLALGLKKLAEKLDW